MASQNAIGWMLVAAAVLLLIAVNQPAWLQVVLPVAALLGYAVGRGGAAKPPLFHGAEKR